MVSNCPNRLPTLGGKYIINNLKREKNKIKSEKRKVYVKEDKGPVSGQFLLLSRRYKEGKRWKLGSFKEVSAGRWYASTDCI